MDAVAELLSQNHPLAPQIAALTEKLASDCEQYKRLYVRMIEAYKNLERGAFRTKAERLTPNDAQLTMEILESLLNQEGDSTAPAARETTIEIPAHRRRKHTGRPAIPDSVPRHRVEILPDVVQAEGIENFDRIGEDSCETLERTPATMKVVVVVRPKFVRKGRSKIDPAEILQALVPGKPIDKGLAGPGLLADTVVKRWGDYLPLNRQEKIYDREGFALDRSTVCGWHGRLADLVYPILLAMWRDALFSPYLCTDATGVMVQEKGRCRNGHFFVVIAPERHVLFHYSPVHEGKVLDQLLNGYRGHLVADAHSIYDHLYKSGDILEVGCWSHLRRYFYKSLDSDPERARRAIAIIKGIFQVEREIAELAPNKKKKAREIRSRPLVTAFFQWCKTEKEVVLDETPISKAINYATNQKQAFLRFLDDGRLPIHNNMSEQQLRREAVGRKNWMFVGNDEAGEVNAIFVSLIASCQMHGVEPWAYLRDIFCLLPTWPADRMLDLAPASWTQTAQSADVKKVLARNPFRAAILPPMT